MKTDIIVGIPSYNEEKTISFVTKQVDLGLSKYFPDKKALIVNADNYSADKTKEVFLSTKTKTEKLYISTPKGVKGKGNNFHNLFELIMERGANSIAVLDADLKSITPEWIKYFLSPLENEGYDFVFPYYWRHPYDGTITNSICYPLTYGLAGYNIRQPIGGDFSFNKKVVSYLLKKEWDNNIRNYGIDIFMTLSVVFDGFNFGQIELGQKIHNPSAPKLSSMFDQVVSTIFNIFLKNEDSWLREIKEVKDIPMISRLKIEKTEIPAPLGIDELRKKENKFISAEEWVDIVYDSLLNFKVNSGHLGDLKEKYFSRAISFIKETEGFSQEKAEDLIKKQAKLFFHKRGELIEKIKGL